MLALNLSSDHPCNFILSVPFGSCLYVSVSAARVIAYEGWMIYKMTRFAISIFLYPIYVCSNVYLSGIIGFNWKQIIFSFF